MTHRYRPQRGITLVELLAVVTLTSALMLVAVSLLGSVLDWGHSATTAAAHASSIDCMEQELRRQLRSAREVILVDRTLSIENDVQRGEWTLAGEACELRIDGADGPRHERYVVGRGAWQIDITERFVEVSIDRSTQNNELPFRVVVARTNAQPENQP